MFCYCTVHKNFYFCFRLDINQAPVGTRVSGTYQPLEGEEDDEESDTHASEQTPQESNDLDQPSSPSSVNPPLSDNQTEDDNGSLTNKCML